ncbi:MAG TPA: glycosyltransferase family 2 protein, partial [Stellaceae bacterium]
QIVVVDDGSTDATASLARDAAAGDRRFAVMEAGALPAGWTGKSHACWCGAVAMQSQWLCFIDADTVARPALLRSAVAVAARRDIDLLSLEPRQELITAWERLIIPAGLCALGFAGDLRRTGDPGRAAAAANGQFILVRRATYERVGGHAAVRDEVAEDSAFAARVKAGGGRVALLDGATLVSARMYRTLPQLWEGLAKNVTETFGGVRATAIVAALGLLLAWAAVAIPAALALTLLPAGPSPLGAAAVGIAVLASLAVTGMHIAASRYFAIPCWYGVLFPIGYTLAALLAMDGISARRHGRIAWKGRIYSASSGTAARR